MLVAEEEDLDQSHTMWQVETGGLWGTSPGLQQEVSWAASGSSGESQREREVGELNPHPNLLQYAWDSAHLLTSQ